ncbi:MAG: Lrp/AsnC family transcriptional regulator [Candidatus Nanoarchaeia archaeon]
MDKLREEPHTQKILKKDIVLLQQLRANARTSLTQMSKQTRIPISTLFDRLRANEDSLITKHTSLVDFKKLGYDARAQVLLKVPFQFRSHLESYLRVHDSVNSLFRLANGFHFLVECIFPSISQVEPFIRLLEEKFGVFEYQTNYIVDDIKREGFFSAS